VNSASSVESLENELRTLLRLRLKHQPVSSEAKSYRGAIKDRASRLKALRLAQMANRDLILPPIRKKSFYRGGTMPLADESPTN
jgi:hypothetical protein